MLTHVNSSAINPSLKDLLFQVTGAEPLVAGATGGGMTTGGGTTTGVAGGGAEPAAGAVAGAVAAAAGGFMAGGATTGGTRLPPAMPMLLRPAHGLKVLETAGNC